MIKKKKSIRDTSACTVSIFVNGSVTGNIVVDSCTPKMDIRNLPFPFSLLDVRKAKSSS